MSDLGLILKHALSSVDDLFLFKPKSRNEEYQLFFQYCASRMQNFCRCLVIYTASGFG